MKNKNILILSGIILKLLETFKKKRGLSESQPLYLCYSNTVYRSSYFFYKTIPMILGYKFRNKSKSIDKLHKKHSKTLVNVCNNLGGIYVKLGQQFSSSKDIFPQIYQKRLEPLLENVKPINYKNIELILKKENILNKLDFIEKTPIGVASLGQVYRASYKGNNIVLKVLKPYVKENTKGDLYVINMAIKLGLPGLTRLMSDFSRITLTEFNFLDEANIMLELKKNVSLEGIYFPNIYLEISTSKVLCLEYIKGESLLNYIKKGNVENNMYLFGKVMEVMYHQIFLVGLFTSDPHPGNFFVQERGEDKPLLIPLDFGQVGRLDKKNIEYLKRLLYALHNNNDIDILRTLDLMGFKSKKVGEHIDKLKVRYAQCMFKDYMLENVHTFNKLTNDIDWYEIPIEYMLINKAFITLTGLISFSKLDISLIDLFVIIDTAFNSGKINL